VFFVDRKVFPLTGKCFPLTNFPNGKQTQESLESGFPESEFQRTNMALEWFVNCWRLRLFQWRTLVRVLSACGQLDCLEFGQ